MVDDQERHADNSRHARHQQLRSSSTRKLLAFMLVQGVFGGEVGQLSHGLQVDLPLRCNGMGPSSIGSPGLGCSPFGLDATGGGLDLGTAEGMPVAAAAGERNIGVVGPDGGTESPRERASKRDIYSSIDTSSPAFDSADCLELETGAEISMGGFSNKRSQSGSSLKFAFSSDCSSSFARSISGLVCGNIVAWSTGTMFGGVTGVAAALLSGATDSDSEAIRSECSAADMTADASAAAIFSASSRLRSASSFSRDWSSSSRASYCRCSSPSRSPCALNSACRSCNCNSQASICRPTSLFWPSKAACSSCNARFCASSSASWAAR